MKLNHSLIPNTTANSKWIKDLNARPDTTKLEENNRMILDRKHYDINHSNIFLYPFLE